MGRPVKWSRDVHALRERASRSRTETWSRQDIERLFSISRASAQNLMKAIGEVQAVGGTHFVERAALVTFLDDMIQAPAIDDAFRNRLVSSEPPPKPRSLRFSLSADLRHAMMPDLPANITLEPGRLEIRAETAISMIESLVALAMVMQNDLNRFEATVRKAKPDGIDQALAATLTQMRKRSGNT